MAWFSIGKANLACFEIFKIPDVAILSGIYYFLIDFITSEQIQISLPCDGLFETLVKYPSWHKTSTYSAYHDLDKLNLM